MYICWCYNKIQAHSIKLVLSIIARQYNTANMEGALDLEAFEKNQKFLKVVDWSSKPSLTHDCIKHAALSND